jgi:uncharacterized membrane protein YkvA (DUF1232 family)
MLRLLRLWRLGAHDLRLIWYALRHPERPLWLLPVAALLAVYALDPANLALPVLGVIDDFLLLPMLLHVVVRFLPAAIRSDFAPRGRVIEIDRQSADRARPRAGSSRSQGR